MIALTQTQIDQVSGANCVYGSSSFDAGAIIEISAGFYQICVYDPSSDPMYYWSVYGGSC
jgi:hypothetical protein